MTMTVTQSVVDAYLLWSGAGAGPEEADRRARLRRMWPTIFAFVLGAACGAAGYAFARLWCLLLPAALCLLLSERQ